VRKVKSAGFVKKISIFANVKGIYALTVVSHWHGFSLGFAKAVLRIRDVHPGSEFFHLGSRVANIPDPEPYPKM
jgi:hypothetical protein